MTSALSRWWLPVLVAALVLALTLSVAARRGQRAGVGGTTGFAAQVDLRPLGAVAVQSEGRLKSFDSFAEGMMAFVSGSKRIAGQSPAFTYLDMLIRPGAYGDADVIYVKNKSVRAQIASTLVAARPELDERLEAFVQTGLLAPELLLDPALGPLIDRLRADLIRTEKSVSAINTALVVMRPETLLDRLRIVPAEEAGSGTGDSAADAAALAAGGRWLGVTVLLPERVGDGGPGAAAGAVGGGLVPVPGLDPDLQRTLAAQWADLVNGWGRQDPALVNSAVAGLATLLPTVLPGEYPPAGRLRMESLYFALGHMSWGWLVYILAILPLLMWAVYRWPTALRLGIALFVAAFLLQSAAVAMRWYVSGRWPNSNMFEAVITASWFGACAALLLEVVASRSAMRGLFALGAATAAMVALMAAHFLPAYLNPQIGNMMPVLHDVWLYIHTNVIIFSYCLIFMAAVSACLYLGWRLLGGGPDYAKVGGAGTLILRERFAGAERRAVALPGGGAVDLVAGPRPAAAVPPGGAVATAALRRASPGEVFDGVTMVLMESAFVLLWAGIVMGALWADHSWGRPWGWDPKEVFALNTFLVFAILIHVRIKAADKGLWTAILAVVGAGVMLFNWIVINFVITGLHSYA